MQMSFIYQTRSITTTICNKIFERSKKFGLNTLDLISFQMCEINYISITNEDNYINFIYK